MEFQTEFRAPEPCPTVPNEVYLFVTNLEVHDQGTAPFPEAFWSTSALGDQCLSETMMSEWGLEMPEISLSVGGYSWYARHFESLRDVHRACGFDPLSDEVVHFVGVPLVRVAQIMRECPCVS